MIKRYVAPLSFGALLSLLVVTIASALVGDPQVKMSSSGFCHKIGGAYYSQTFNFKPYGSLVECLDSGGKEPSR